MEELHDIAAAMSEILQKMEQCRDVVQGRSQYAPKSKKDMMRTLKASHRTCELEKEEVQMMYQPQMVPKYNTRSNRQKTQMRMTLKRKRKKRK